MFESKGRKNMSVVVCKVSKDKIEMASDSIAVKGCTKINNA